MSIVVEQYLVDKRLYLNLYCPQISNNLNDIIDYNISIGTFPTHRPFYQILIRAASASTTRNVWSEVSEIRALHQFPLPVGCGNLSSGQSARLTCLSQTLVVIIWFFSSWNQRTENINCSLWNLQQTNLCGFCTRRKKSRPYWLPKCECVSTL